MSNVYDLRQSGRALSDASGWIARLDRGLDDSEKAELRKFLDDPVARTHFLELAEHWDKLDALDRLGDIMPAVDKEPSRSMFRYATAAALLVALITGFFYLQYGINSDVAIEPTAFLSVYETAVGERSSVKLADGSGVTLNTNSRISVLFSNTGRLVYLERGEAHFIVAKDMHRPFSVRAGYALIQAVGTEFSVQLSTTDQIELIVVEGAIRVETSPDVIGRSRHNVPPGLLPTGQTVTAGSIATYSAAMGEIHSIEIDEIEAKLSWRSGSLVFRGESLQLAVEEIERYTSVKFVFMDERTKRIPVAGLFKAGDVDGLLDSLQANFNIAYQRIGDNQILLSGQ